MHHPQSGFPEQLYRERIHILCRSPLESTQLSSSRVYFVESYNRPPRPLGVLSVAISSPTPSSVTGTVPRGLLRLAARRRLFSRPTHAGTRSVLRSCLPSGICASFSFRAPYSEAPR